MPNPEDDKTSCGSAAKRQPRQSRLVAAVFECDRFGRFNVTLRNISQTGVGGTGPHALRTSERLTVELPGHKPMKGTVRWVSGQVFGIETDEPIDASRLRAVHDGTLVTADSKADFQIVPAPTVQPWRPGLKRMTAIPSHFGRREPDS